MQIQHTDGLCNGRGKKEELSPLCFLPELSEAFSCALCNHKFIVKHSTQMMMIAFITFKSSLVPLLEGL